MKLENGSLYGAQLNGVNGEMILDKVNMRKAAFCGADIPHCEITGCYAAETNFSGAVLNEGILDGSTFKKSTFNNASLFSVQAKGTDFRECSMRNVCFVDADLTNADFRGADLTDSDFDGADVTGCKFQGAILTGVEHLN